MGPVRWTFLARLSRRELRAVAAIAVAVIAVLAAGSVYLYPNLTAKTSRPSATPDGEGFVTRAGHFVTFDFLTPSLGWALDVPRDPPAQQGPFWVFRTVDGARHWRVQLEGQAGGIGGSVQFFDKNHGFVEIAYAVPGNANAFFRTTDGGDHWISVALPTSGVRTQVAFSDASHGWLLGLPAGPGPAKLYSTRDAGDSWQVLPDAPIDSNALTFRGSSEGWIGSFATGPAHVYSSTDGGHLWQRHYLPALPVTPADALPTEVRLLPGTGVVARGAGWTDEFTSFDGGASWTHVELRPRQVFPGLDSFEDASRWWAIDGGVLYKSLDAGQTWTPAADELANGTFWVYVVHVIDSKHAWAGVEIGQVLGLVLTSDGGRNWTRVSVPQAP
jgi:photosystem II stability/assembly factor-like uncharacterized protein